MTRKEVINFLKGYLDEEVYSEKCRNAHKIAIQALEQEPCEDCISRADVKKYLSAPDANGDRVIYESDLDLLPPVTPQQKTGHWIQVDSDKCKCDQCEVICFIATYPFGRKNYCPNCGCRMESEE